MSTFRWKQPHLVRICISIILTGGTRKGFSTHFEYIAFFPDTPLVWWQKVPFSIGTFVVYKADLVKPNVTIHLLSQMTKQRHLQRSSAPNFPWNVVYSFVFTNVNKNVNELTFWRGGETDGLKWEITARQKGRFSDRVGHFADEGQRHCKLK